MEKGMLKETDDYSILAGDEFRSMFSQYKVAVGSTGNLGLSIGIISAAIGFQVTVHMSADARQWKKDMLRSKGVVVVEYPDDYEAAVAQGRREAEADPMCHFVDDENSMDLFEGYSAAGKRLKKQLDDLGITVDAKRRLYVYLPCGVGGAPGGVTYGIKKYFGENAYCFFAEPTNACCMMLGMATGKHSDISVADIGIDGKTDAYGLAVGRASGFVGRLMEPFMSGCYTMTDERMYRYLTMLADAEQIYLEPSALAGMYGPVLVASDAAFARYGQYENCTHIVWATGGSMVPAEIMEQYYAKGKQA
jgi:D-serine dehydratase